MNFVFTQLGGSKKKIQFSDWLDSVELKITILSWIHVNIRFDYPRQS